MHNKAVWQVVLGILVLLAGSEWILRGPVRFVRGRDFNDLISPYTQSNLWIRGTDPYSPANLVRFWPPEASRPDFLAKDLADDSLVYKRGIPTAYPPSCLLILAPLAVLPWPIAHALWLALSVLAYSAAVASLLSLTDLCQSPHRMYLFVAFALGLAPFHTGMAAGSIAIVTVGVITSAMWAASQERDVMAGVLIALAVGLKPQLGLPFLFYYLVRRRWQISGIAIGLTAVLSLLAIFRLWAGGVPWVQSYLYDNRVLFAPGSLGDFTELNPIRFGLINLQLPIYAIFGNREMANVLAMLVALTLGAVWLILIRRAGSTRNELLELSALAMLCLLPIYHRLYDASLLILPLSWCFVALTGHLKLLAKGALLLILPFLVPGGSALEQLRHTGHFSALQHSRWWNGIVMSHQAWCLFFLSLVLLKALSMKGKEAAEEAAEKVLWHDKSDHRG